MYTSWAEKVAYAAGTKHRSPTTFSIAIVFFYFFSPLPLFFTRAARVWFPTTMTTVFSGHDARRGVCWRRAERGGGRRENDHPAENRGASRGSRDQPLLPGRSVSHRSVFLRRLSDEGNWSGTRNLAFVMHDVYHRSSRKIQPPRDRFAKLDYS